MKTKKYPSVTLCNVVCVILMVVLLVLHFTPFWELDGQQISIGGYIWLPTWYENLTVHFQEVVDPNFKVDSLVLFSFMQLLLPAAGITLLLYNKKSMYIPICTAVCGAGLLWSFLTKPVFRLGGSWLVYPVLAVVVLAAAVAGIYARSRSLRGTEK